MPPQNASPRCGWSAVIPGLFVAAFALKASAAPMVLEAENGTRTGSAYVSTAVSGYSGTGYVTGLQSASDTVIWNFTGTPGLYDLVIRFRSPFGPKGFAGAINGHGFSGMFPSNSAFASADIGLVELTAGANTLWVGGGWNWYEIDRVDLNPVPAPLPPAPVPATLVDPQATFAARMLMQALVSDYGKHTWAGQHDSNEISYIQGKTGLKPAIVEGDLIDYSPSRVQYGGLPVNYTEGYLTLQNAGHVLGLCWHWNAPTNLINTVGHEWWRGFYTDATTFDVAAALANTNSAEYGLILRDIDAIAVQLKKISSNNVPVLWRPLHEATGGWFWWGAKGSGPFKQLWRLLYNRLTTYHNLHNLIWILADEDPDWYPGDDVVDIVGVDAYPSDPTDALSTSWENLKSRFDGVKLLTLSEFGGVPDIERMHVFGVWWSYFSPWGGYFVEDALTNSASQRIYQSPEVITLDELNAVPPLIVSNKPAADGVFQLAGTGPRGAVYRLLASTNIGLPPANWLQLTNATFSGGVFTFTDQQATNYARRFYRIATP